MKLEVDKFYTWSSTLTVAGMASMLWVVLGTLSSAFSWRYPGWFPLLLALVFVVTGDLAQQAAISGKAREQRWLARVPLWLVNACLVYTTTVGGAHAVLPSVQAQTDARVNEAVVHASSDPDQRPEPPLPASPAPAEAAPHAPAEAPAHVRKPAAAKPSRTAPSTRPSAEPAPASEPGVALPEPATTASEARAELQRTAARVDVTKLKQALQAPPRVGFTRILDAQLIAADAKN